MRPGLSEQKSYVKWTHKRTHDASCGLPCSYSMGKRRGLDTLHAHPASTTARSFMKESCRFEMLARPVAANHGPILRWDDHCVRIEPERASHVGPVHVVLCRDGR